MSVAQTGMVAQRSLTRTLRQPALIAPSIIFPLVLLSVNASGLESATKIPGFPTDAYVNFAIIVTFIQGALFAAISAGTSLAVDIETGFLNRLQLTPLRRVPLLVGELAGAIGVAVLGTLIYVVVGLAVGVSFATGVLGALALILYAIVTAIAFAAIGATMGVRTGSAQAVQGIFPLMFVLLFLSSSSMPRPLIEIDWFRTVATWNPVSYIIEGMRALVVEGWDVTALARGLGVVAAVLALSLWAASRALATRMERT